MSLWRVCVHNTELECTIIPNSCGLQRGPSSGVLWRWPAPPPPPPGRRAVEDTHLSLWHHPQWSCLLACLSSPLTVPCSVPARASQDPGLPGSHTSAWFYVLLCRCEGERRSSWTGSHRLQHKPVSCHSDRLLRRQRKSHMASMWSHRITNRSFARSCRDVQDEKNGKQKIAEILDTPRPSWSQGKCPFPTRFSRTLWENTARPACPRVSPALQFLTMVYLQVCFHTM